MHRAKGSYNYTNFYIDTYTCTVHNIPMLDGQAWCSSSVELALGEMLCQLNGILPETYCMTRTYKFLLIL